ncbi:hypothetical protein TeGR_g6809 [Tetraparma gracilis]|uniref:Uncharacterized protein n=1 Tax=Tetraparma gracilis TaxID=2962635 RepID=A0ABQ6MX52_9STRA|nr:hypothetical protein TeGR_g6809 [Tetraparma gracilis]
MLQGERGAALAWDSLTAAQRASVKADLERAVAEKKNAGANLPQQVADRGGVPRRSPATGATTPSRRVSIITVGTVTVSSGSGKKRYHSRCTGPGVASGMLEANMAGLGVDALAAAQRASLKVDLGWVVAEKKRVGYWGKVVAFAPGSDPGSSSSDVVRRRPRRPAARKKAGHARTSATPSPRVLASDSDPFSSSSSDPSAKPSKRVLASSSSSDASSGTATPPRAARKSKKKKKRATPPPPPPPPPLPPAPSLAAQLLSNQATMLRLLESGTISEVSFRSSAALASSAVEHARRGSGGV